MTYTIGICDDSLEQIKVIREYLKRYCGQDSIETIESTNPPKFLSLLENRKPDCVFLDIDMGQYNGIDLGRSIHDRMPKLPIVYVTAFRKYAAEAFNVRAFHYLIKPITPKQINQLLDELCLYLKEQKKLTQAKTLVIKTRKETVSLDCQEILYFEKDAHRIWVRTEQRDLYYYDNFSNLLEEIDSSVFLRCHQGYIVNIHKVKSYCNNTLELSGGVQLPVSRTYGDMVREALANKLFGIGGL